RFGLMLGLDQWVIERVFDLHGRHASPRRFFIHLCGATLDDPHFAAFVTDRAAHHGIDPKGVVFEITEQVAISRLMRARATLETLLNQGFQFALDDFGTGVASFGYLDELPVQFVKLSERYIRYLDSDPASGIIVRALVDLAHLHGLSCIGEGVENAAVLQSVQNLGIDFVQGYHLHYPEPLEEVEDPTSPSSTMPRPPEAAR
ncbi:MAG: EAL domain-containing protein, partial [Candidatus Competibacterales bacterium]